MMDAPPLSHPRWRDLVTGKISRDWNSLAMKIMMTRILREAGPNASSDAIRQATSEVQSFFQKNAKVTQADLALIFG